MTINEPPASQEPKPQDMVESSTQALNVDEVVIPFPGSKKKMPRFLTIKIEDDDLRIKTEIMEQRTGINARVLLMEAWRDYVDMWVNSDGL
jgi:hypothetical protein